MNLDSDNRNELTALGPILPDYMSSTMFKWFGSYEEKGPYKFLLSHGYYLDQYFTIMKPVSAHTVNRDEWLCICFLVNHHNFGFYTSV